MLSEVIEIRTIIKGLIIEIKTRKITIIRALIMELNTRKIIKKISSRNRYVR